MTPNAPGYEQSERALVMRAQEGDASAIAALLVRYRKWIRGRASSMTVSGMDADDLSQEGMIGLVQAIRTFDPSREVQFRTYATTCIHNRMVGAAKLARTAEESTAQRIPSPRRGIGCGGTDGGRRGQPRIACDPQGGDRGVADEDCRSPQRL